MSLTHSDAAHYVLLPVLTIAECYLRADVLLLPQQILQTACLHTELLPTSHGAIFSHYQHNMPSIVSYCWIQA